MAISIHDYVCLHKFVATWKFHCLKPPRSLHMSKKWQRYTNTPRTRRWKNIVQGGAHYPYVKRPDIFMISDGLDSNITWTLCFPSRSVSKVIWGLNVTAWHYRLLVEIWCDFDRASSLICGNKLPTRCNRGFLLHILLLAQHISGTTMPIIRSSGVLYSGCCLWYFVL